MTATHAVLVALGAAVGAPLRLLTDTAVTTTLRRRSARRGRAVPAFPAGTLAVNLSACLLLGAVVGAGTSNGWAALLGTGLAGALSTYSTFGFELAQLLREGRSATAGSALVVSVIAGPLAAAAGLLFGQLLR